MKYTVLRDSLLTTLQKAGFFTSYKLGDIEALKCIYMKATQRGIVIKSTNINNSFFGEVGGKVEEEGEALVDYKTLVEVVKNIGDEKVFVEKKKGGLFLQTSKGTIQIPTLDETTFPHEEELLWEEQNKEIFLQKDIDLVVFAAATDETRPVLTGIYFDIRTDGVFIVATDGFRLSLLTKKIKDAGILKGKKIIIPARGLQTAIKTLGREIKKIETDKELTRIRLSSEEGYIIIRFLEGEFPLYEKAIPKQTTTSVQFNTEEFFTSLKTVSLFSKDGSNMIEVSIKDAFLELSSVRSTNGEACLRVPLTNKEGNDKKIVFNHKFISAFISASQAKEIIFEMDEQNLPGIFKEAGKNDFLHIIMPIRSQD